MNEYIYFNEMAQWLYTLFILLSKFGAAFACGVVATLLLSRHFRFVEQRRLTRAKVARALSKRGANAVREILQEVPNWIEDPDLESMEWFNKCFSDRLWYYISATTADQVRSALDVAFLKPPMPLRSISVQEFTLGQSPPIITGVRFIGRTKLICFFLKLYLFDALKSLSPLSVNYYVILLNIYPITIVQNVRSIKLLT